MNVNGRGLTVTVAPRPFFIRFPSQNLLAFPAYLNFFLGVQLDSVHISHSTKIFLMSQSLIV